MYTTFVRPILEYIPEVWGGCNQTDAEKLEKLQISCYDSHRFIIKFCTQSPYQFYCKF
jgi:hypothetical protein